VRREVARRVTIGLAIGTAVLAIPAAYVAQAIWKLHQELWPLGKVSVHNFHFSSAHAADKELIFYFGPDGPYTSHWQKPNPPTTRRVYYVLFDYMIYVWYPEKNAWLMYAPNT
jgi:hypothetical protein